MRFALDNTLVHTQLFPITLTRPASEILIGLHSQKSRFETHGEIIGEHADDYLEIPTCLANLWINSAVVATDSLMLAIQALEPNQSLLSTEGVLIATHSTEAVSGLLEQATKIEYTGTCIALTRPWHFFQQAGAILEIDLANLKDNRNCLSPSNRVFGNYPVFIEEGVWAECAIINAEKGPVYIGKNCVLQENSIIRGPFVLHESSEIKMGARMSGPTSIGPHCKVGGETTNIIIQGYSNKGHDGYLGNAVLGEWCNLGADTNSSNLKNNYTTVTAYSYQEKKDISVGDIFCGLIMGDHSKCGINTMFNTGTVVGVSANIFGADFPPKYIPSFSWGGADGMKAYTFPIAIKVAKAVMARRKRELSDKELRILQYVSELDALN